MYKRRRSFSLGNLMGLICCVIGICIMIYVIPFKAWIFMFGCGFILVGIIIFKL
ncbi:hypothetical protein [Alkaliphilus serpentinus]|uniref:hypothetical protein n=1 Tax=Alkaliphilus serpentinus TaxID=1482731 RepID=UPI00186577D1|nr:hypothetical protein [Alkaliphilus serpentinus]